MAADPEPRVLYIVSDATGETAYRVTRAALTQFKDHLVDIRWRQGTRTVEQVKEIVCEAAQTNALIVHSLVIPELRQAILDESRIHSVTIHDVIGPALMHLSDWLEDQPAHRPAVLDQINESYFQRITALEYAVRHDDGRNAGELDRADLVLVGVSRTSKTPLSIYFAYRGWMVGNVPLVMGIEPPDILFKLPRSRVVALTVRADRLATLRSKRQNRLKMKGSYDSTDAIGDELRHAREIIARGGWPTVDMSIKSIEEAASEILELVEKALY
ncbi:MAG: kinase/pyrophosphorylase [Anaerolineae bacterium]|nr:kinase/pyrophosphorylase [Anaerolineae bacterium]